MAASGHFHTQPSTMHDVASKVDERANSIGSAGQSIGSTQLSGLGSLGSSLEGSAGQHYQHAAQIVNKAATQHHGMASTLHQNAQNYEQIESENVNRFGAITKGQDSGTTRPSGSEPTGPSGQGSGGSGGSAWQSPNRPGDPQETSLSGAGRNCVSDPVDVATGEVVLIEHDLSLPAPLSFVLERTHLSNYRAGRWFGPSWSSTVDQRLELDDEGVCFVAPDGLILVYPQPSPGESVLPAAGHNWPLAMTDGGGYTVTLPDRTLSFRTRSGPRQAIVELDAITDESGVRIDIERDDQHVPTLLLHSAGYRVALHNSGGRITELHVLGSEPDVDVPVARYGYDERGRLTEVVNSSGLPSRFSYDSVGRLTGWQDRNGMEYRYDYDEAGRCVRTSGTDDFVNSTLHYDEVRLATTVTNSLGQVSVYQLNALRQTIAETDPLGNVTSFEWDRRHRLLSRTDPLGRVTRFEYDADGEVAAVVRPDGSRVGVDARGPLTISVEADGRRYSRTYADAQPDPLTVALGVSDTAASVATLGAGETTTTAGTAGAAGTRDVFGRPVGTVDQAGRQVRLGWTVEGKPAWRATPAAREQWRYDPEGNQTEHVDSVGQVSRSEYGPFDLRTAGVDATGARTGYTYDTELRLVSVTNPHGQLWRYGYDPAGRIAESVDFDGRTQRFGYDAAGQLVRTENAAGQVIEYRYDAIGNLVEQRTETGGITYAYDPVGNLVAARGPDGELTIERDETGRITAQTTNGRTTTFGYEPDGGGKRRRTPSGVDSEWRYAASGRPASVTVAGHTTAIDYDDAGRELSRRLDDVVLLRRTVDAASGTETVTVGGDRSRRYQYRPDDRLIGVDDTAEGPIRLRLDAEGRITELTAADRTEHYAYDATGNLTASAAGAHSYHGNTVAAAGDTHYDHDAQGRLVHRWQGGRHWHYAWDALDRLTGVLLPDGSRWQYRYDPLGRRIAKHHVDDTGRMIERFDFVWDGAVLIEQTHTDATGEHVTTWEHHPDDDRPLTQLDTERSAQPASGIQRFYTIVTDPLGTPVELLDTGGATAWRSRTTLWGVPLAGRTGPVSTPLRFPGQYHDAETGLHYNVYRYYDPATARYLSPDPLGLAPAPNPVAYVSNPWHTADPLGLSPNGGCGTSSNTNPVTPGHNATPGLVGNTASGSATRGISDSTFNSANHTITDPDGQLVNSANNYVTAMAGTDKKTKTDASEALGESGALAYLRDHTGNQNIGLHRPTADPNNPPSFPTNPGQPWTHAVAFNGSGVTDVSYWDGNQMHVIEAKGGGSSLGGRNQAYFHQDTSGTNVYNTIMTQGKANGFDMVTGKGNAVNATQYAGGWINYQAGDLRPPALNAYAPTSVYQGTTPYLTDIAHQMTNSNVADGRNDVGQAILNAPPSNVHYVPVYTNVDQNGGISVGVNQRPS